MKQRDVLDKELKEKHHFNLLRSSLRENFLIVRRAYHIMLP